MKNFKLVVVILITISSIFSIKTTGQGLRSLAGGVTTYGAVHAFTYDSINNVFYAGGMFNYMDGVEAKNIARWDGSKWQSILDTIDGTIYSTIAVDGKLYAGGPFTHIDSMEIKNIAVWDGNEWNKVGDELQYAAGQIIYFKNHIYALTAREDSGTYTQVLLKLENNKWDKVLEFNSLNEIHVAETKNRLCFIGGFSKVNDTLANMAIEYDGNKINYLPLPFDVAIVGRPFDAVYVKDTLYLKSLNTIQRLVNNTWEIISNLYGQKLFEYQNNLCVVEESTNPANTDQHILKLAKVYHGALGDILGYIIHDVIKNQTIFSIDVYNDKLYVSGFFDNLNGNYSSLCLMEYDSVQWKNIGKPAFMSYVDQFFSTRTYDLYNDSVSNSLYVAGKFDFAGGVYSQNIATWNGTKWSNSGDGFNAEVLKILRYKNELYAFGVFTRSGTKSINRIARWNGFEWTTIGTGANNGVLDAKVFNGELYICGYFDKVNGVNAKYVAKFDGMNWSTVGNNNLDNAGKKLFDFNGELYIAAQTRFYLGSNVSYSYMAVLRNPGWVYFSAPYLTAGLGSAVVYNNELYMIDQEMNFCKGKQGGTWESLATGNQFFDNTGTSPFYPSILIVNNKIWISTWNHEMYLYDHDTLMILSKSLFPKYLNPTSVCKYENNTIIAGNMIGYQDAPGAEIKYLNNVGVLEFSNTGFDIQLTSSDICEGDSVHFSLISNDPFAKIKWYFNGGSPDTSLLYDPVSTYPNAGNFTVFVEVNNTMGIDTIFLPGPVKVKDCIIDTVHTATSIIVFPNPGSGLITIKSDVTPQNVKLTDILGQTIFESVNTNTIDLSSFSRAMYLLSFRINDETYQVKVIKN